MLFPFAASALLLSSAAAQPAAPTIATPCGPISGATDVTPFAPLPVFRYAAIPYAAPPLGALRFRPPQPPACPWPGTRNGSAPMAECVQPSGSGAEDCLQLSVFMPANHTPGAAPPLPVLVYVHGGNLISSAAPVSQLEVLAAQNSMVTVGVNYRLNVLGFLALEEFAEEPGWVGNSGIADAIAALQWVQRSISAFGGDPARVTIAGQSSGGTLIFALFSAPSAAGLFTGALSMSGSPNITQGAAAKRAQDAPILAALNCSAPPTAPLRVACLRALPASALGLATPKPSWDTPGIFGWGLPVGIPPPSAGGWAYAGIVHVDGVLLTAPFHEALAGELVPAALIISNMEAEGDGGGGIGVRNASWAAWEAALNASFAGWPGGAGAAARVADAYRAEAVVDADLAYGSINSDFGLSCAARELAGLVAATGRPRAHPLYIMYNAWQRGTWSPNGNGRWPYHGLDWQAAGWGWSAGVVPQPSDFAEAELMQRLIADFAAGAGVLPAAWGWPPVAPGAALRTFVAAQEAGWPGGGSRAVEGWKERQCGALAALGFGQTYWWCD